MQEGNRRAAPRSRFAVTTILILALTLPAFAGGWRDPGDGIIERILHRATQWITVALDVIDVPTGGAGG